MKVYKLRPKPGKTVRTKFSKKRQQKADASRDVGVRRLYDRKWAKFSRGLRQEFPACVLCFSIGKITMAAVVDHWLPHKGDIGLFWEEGNHAPLCKWCHDNAKRKMETGYNRTGVMKEMPPLVTLGMISEFLVNGKTAQ